MRIAVDFSEEGSFRRAIAEAFVEGFVRHGLSDFIAVNNRSKYTFSYDAILLIGVISCDKAFIRSKIEQGVAVIYVDKGYIRLPDFKDPISKTLYYRVSLNSEQPHHYLFSSDLPDDRWKALKIPIKKMKHYDNGHILFAGSSQKYCDFYALGDATVYARDTFDSLRPHLDKDRDFVYRPKPSWGNAVPIDGTLYSGPKDKLRTALKGNGGCYSLITHGSNAALESLIEGFPCVVLGNGIAKSLARNSLDDINDLIYPSERERHRLFKQLAYHQYTLDEIRKGVAWHFLKPYLEITPDD